MGSPRPRLLVLAPIAPAPTGNGLAMRVWSWVAAAGVHHDVDLVVVPIAGSTGIETPPPAGVVSVHVIAAAEVSPRAVVDWLIDPRWRARYADLEPLYPAVLGAPPSLAGDVLDAVVASQAAAPVSPPVAILACRLGLVPLALALAENLGVELVVDADDDEVEYHRTRGDAALSAAADRVCRTCLPAARWVAVANPSDAATLADRYALRSTVTVPNAVEIPAVTTPAPGTSRLLFVANFTYAPNLEGARWLVDQVLPLLDPVVSIDLVGEHGGALDGVAGDRVRVHGFADDIAGAYAYADVCVVPIFSGSGTRIKVIEAFAHGRVVVSTTLGAEGTGARDGVHVVLADDAAAFAAAIDRALEAGTSGPLVTAARALVASNFAPEAVGARIAESLSVVTGVDVASSR